MHQLRLIDQNLPGLARELAMASWRAVDSLLPERSRSSLYRSLCRSIRRVLRARVEAFRFCGARVCDPSPRTPSHTAEWAERFPPEPWRIHLYVMPPEAPPSIFLNELLRVALRAATLRLPGRPLKGIARLLRRQYERILQGRLTPSEVCGHTPLCAVNEPYDPWDLRDPINWTRKR